jgi:hypothetical protein
MGREGTRPPITAEELEIVDDLDGKVFEELKKLIDMESGNRDPAYMAWATRRHWFWHYYKFPMPPLEARPPLGAPAVLWYQEERPWIVPGLELLKRQRYPMGWDEYVGSESVPKAAESEKLSALKKELKDALEAKAIREIEAQLQILEQEEEEAKLAEAAAKQKRQELAGKREEATSMEAQKAEIQAAAKKSGHQGFGIASVKSNSMNKGLDSSKWNKKRKQREISVEDDFLPLETKDRLQTTSPGPAQGSDAHSKPSEAATKRQVNDHGWKSKIRSWPIGSS